jgi:hypothetical protein
MSDCPKPTNKARLSIDAINIFFMIFLLFVRALSVRAELVS